jgi:hypothetical protein
MKHFQRIQWGVLVLILVLSVVGCEEFAQKHTVGPTVPTGLSPNPMQLANCWVGRGQNKFGVYTEPGLLQVQAPAGVFLLMYRTNLGAFYFVFSSTDGAFLAIGLLEGDELHEVTLQEGTIPDGTTPEFESEGVNIFCWPGSTTAVSWENVFVIKPATVLIVLIRDGEIVTDNLDIVILDIPKVEGPPQKFSISTEVEGTGDVWPSSLEGVPRGASRSFKFRPGANLVDVTLNGVSVIDAVQFLGNGDGHLVIHDIKEDIHIVATFNP